MSCVFNQKPSIRQIVNGKVYIRYVVLSAQPMFSNTLFTLFVGAQCIFQVWKVISDDPHIKYNYFFLNHFEDWQPQWLYVFVVAISIFTNKKKWILHFSGDHILDYSNFMPCSRGTKFWTNAMNQSFTLAWCRKNFIS